MAKKEYPQTVGDELLEAWKKHQRYGDVKQMCEALGFSHPVIFRALKFGHVASPQLVDLITGFFVARLRKEKDAANVMNGLADDFLQLEAQATKKTPKKNIIKQLRKLAKEKTK